MVSAIDEQRQLAEHYADVCKEIFAKESISESDKEEIQTLCAIAIELIKSSSPSKLREAARIVEIRSYKDKIK